MVATVTQPPSAVQIVLLGDSTTLCAICRQALPDDPRLEDIVKGTLQRTPGVPPVNVINLGLDGEDLHRFLASGRYDMAVTPLPRLDYVLIRYGINDVARLQNFDDRFPLLLRQLVGRVRHDFPRATIVLMTNVPFRGPETDARVNTAVKRACAAESLECFDLYASYYERSRQAPDAFTLRRYPLSAIPLSQVDRAKPFVRGTDVVVMDTHLDAVFGRLPDWFSDRHPNRAGFQMIGEQIAAFLAPDLQRHSRQM
jgi:lysophospholipase L1-like esterase